MRSRLVRFHVNGEKHEFALEPGKKLVDFLREYLGLTGAKPACRTGHCGACKVIIDGVAVNSCLIPMEDVDGKEVLTIEGLSKNDDLHPIQRAFVVSGAIQCGYCTPGMVISAKVFLDKNPSPTEVEVRKALSGNLCRCTGYKKQVEAVLLAAQWMKEASHP
ncbi:MAG TPA: (2Fe-2S)-binding protein [Candidatus Bathyarchaeia archaeon]|nr:(2Fe-2S)-binding protein [Candidatus Bathyarchaeia archaeon]